MTLRSLDLHYTAFDFITVLYITHHWTSRSTESYLDYKSWLYPVRLTLTHPAGSNKPHRVVDPSSDRISARWPLDNSCTRRYIKGRCSEARRPPSDLSSLHCDDTRRLIASQGSLWSPLWSYTCGLSGVSVRMLTCMCPTVFCRFATLPLTVQLKLHVCVRTIDCIWHSCACTCSSCVCASVCLYVYVRLPARGKICVLLPVSFCPFSCICERLRVCFSHTFASVGIDLCIRLHVCVRMFICLRGNSAHSSTVHLNLCICLLARVRLFARLWVRLDTPVFIRVVCSQVSMPASNFGQWMWL